MKRKIVIIAAVMLVAAMLAAQAQQQNTSSSPFAPVQISPTVMSSSLAQPIQRVNGVVLTQQDLLREMYAIFPYARQHNGFPKAMEAEIRRGALLMITFEELVYQEAQRRKMTIAPARLAKAERDFQKQFGSPQQYQEFLKAEVNNSPRELRARIRRSLLIEDLLKIEVTNKSAVTLAETKAFYVKNPQRFQLPELYTLQTITIMPPRPADPKKAPEPPTADQLKQMQARAQDALRQAQQTKNYEEFGILAEKISEDDYRVMMGSHRPTAADKLPPPILEAISKMQVGQMSGIIQADGAYTIVRLNAHTPPRKQKFSEVSKGLRAELEKKKSENLRHQLDARLKKNARIEQIVSNY